MMERNLLVIACAVLLLDSVQCLQWTAGPEDQSVVSLCAQHSLSLPWAVVKEDGDVILDVQWFYNGRSQEVIATLARDSFFVSPPFSGRVTQAANAGLQISHVTSLEAGNYSVEILARDSSGDVLTLHRTVTVRVLDTLPTTDGQLHVSQLPVAEYNTSTDQFHVVLRCGTFTYLTKPPFDVQWTVPSTHTVPSTGYNNGSYYLQLPNPVEGGSYTCLVPPAASCFRENETGEATVKVDKMEARLAVMEGRQAALEARNVALDNENQALKDQVSTLMGNSTALQEQLNMLEGRSTAVEEQVNRLENINVEMTREVSILKNLSQITVSFHARMTNNDHPGVAGVALAPSNVLLNDGDAYNFTTGVFTAPVNGTYFFMASTEVSTSHHGAVISLMVDNVQRDYLSIRSDDHEYAGSVQAVVHLTVGQRVWLRSDYHDSYFWSTPTAFSGFLVSRDI